MWYINRRQEVLKPGSATVAFFDKLHACSYLLVLPSRSYNFIGIELLEMFGIPFLSKSKFPKFAMAPSSQVHIGIDEIKELQGSVLRDYVTACIPTLCWAQENAGPMILVYNHCV